MKQWLDRRLSFVPPSEVAVEISVEVRNCVFGENSEMRPCDVERICENGGFRVKRMDLVRSPKDNQALLVPKMDGGFDILVDPSVNKIGGVESGIDVTDIELHRLRFRVAHEIGHSFFYDRRCKPPKRMLPSSIEEEHFCNYFASALLVPTSVVSKMPVNAETIFSLRRQYKVSAEAAGRALELSKSGITVIGLIWRTNPRDSIGGMRVAWSVGPNFVPKGARLKSLIVDLAHLSSKAIGIEIIKVGGLRGHFMIDAARPRQGSQVIAVLTPANGKEQYIQEMLPLSVVNEHNSVEYFPF